MICSCLPFEAAPEGHLNNRQSHAGLALLRLEEDMQNLSIEERELDLMSLG